MKLPARFALGLLAVLSNLKAETPDTIALIEADWEQQERVSRKQSSSDDDALQGVLRRGRLMVTDMRKLGAVRRADETETLLADVESTLAQLADGTDEERKQTVRNLYKKARWALRSLALDNPKIDFDEIVFVKRQWPNINHQCSHRVGEAQIPGANLCVLKGLSPDGRIRELLDEDHSRGGIGRFDLSYDGKRIVFPYAAPRATPSSYGYGKPGIRGGKCIMYDVYEVHLDGTKLRQLTDNSSAEDTEPIYLPDGRIAFMTSRDDRFVQCGDWALACGLYSMNPDGTGLRRITEPKEGEFYPSMLSDGRIIYTRWDYLMKGYNVIQQLWSVYPDGRDASLVFGDHFAFSVGPIGFFEARQIPGTSKAICIGAAHHNTGVGPVMIVDLEQNRGRRDSMANITPEVGYPEINSRVLREVCQEELPGNGVSNTNGSSGWYSSPYPISENHFLVAASFEKNNASRHGYGIYLMDVHHNRELIYQFPDASCYSPVPLRPRKKPVTIPDLIEGVSPDTPGTLLVTDIYQGLEGVSRGEARYLRILETYPKTVRTTPQRCDIGVNSGWDVRGVLGTVPIEEDGSVCFHVPPHKQLFFEVLDKDYLEIRRMRNFMNVMPGEVNSCVGCHEPYEATPGIGPRLMTLSGRKPAVITPPPWGTGGFGYQEIVQPILDKSCVSCHDGTEGSGKSFDLRGRTMLEAPAGYDRDQSPSPHYQHLVSDSFLNLLKHVSYIRVGGYQGEKLPLPPNATGSRQSALMKTLGNGHYDVKLDLADWRALAAWIDCNAPFYGSWDDVRLPGPDYMAPHVKKRVAERLTQLEGPIAAYLDCGVQNRSAKASGPETIEISQGTPWRFRAPDSLGLSPAHRDIVYDTKELVFTLSKLDPSARYALGITWWDLNADNRKQSVWLSKPDKSGRKLVRESAKLPNYLTHKEAPETFTVNLPEESIENGSTRLIIQCDGGANAVTGEVWIRRLDR